MAENGRPTPGTQLTFPDVLQAETWARTRARELAAATQKAAAVIS